MKKKCTPQNNAIIIKTPVCCPEPIVPIVNGCVDPFTYTWNMAVNQALLDGTLSVQDWFGSLISSGLVLADASNICCSNCKDAPFYFLGGVEIFNTLGGSVPESICCINVAASADMYPNYLENWQVPPACCSNDFESCLNQFSNVVDMLTLLDIGVVEVNGYDNTLLCKIYNLLINTPEDLFQGETLSDVFITIIEKGFISYCCDCNVFIGTPGTFTKWLLNGGCGSSPVPPPQKVYRVYSQVLETGAPYNSIIYRCMGIQFAVCYGTNQTDIDDLVTMFNSNPPVQPNACFLQYGTYFNNGDGRIGCLMPALTYLANCSGGMMSLEVIYD